MEVVNLAEYKKTKRGIEKQVALQNIKALEFELPEFSELSKKLNELTDIMEDRDVE